jgi:site-specific DNA-methyltransferase (adenine-specific)
MKKYKVILADPPWSYQDIGMDWTPSDEQRKYYRSVKNHYSVMRIEDICALPIADLADENCTLFMWCTWPHVFLAERVMNAWGFRYRAIGFVWVKLNPTGLGFHTGMGWYTRGNSEPCFLAGKGKITPANRDVSSLIVTPLREHSRKPDEQYAKIERLYPDVPKIELFARRGRPGWDIWGNELENTIEYDNEKMEWIAK